MKDVRGIRQLYVPSILILFFFLFIPASSIALMPLSEEDLSKKSPSLTSQDEESHLRPINEKQLDDLSPSLVAPEAKAGSKNHSRNSLEFENSICFRRCHNKNALHPDDNTAKQWRLLIEKDGHSIFRDIPWESQQEKQKILDYLLKNAKDAKPGSAGIGVW